MEEQQSTCNSSLEHQVADPCIRLVVYKVFKAQKKAPPWPCFMFDYAFQLINHLRQSGSCGFKMVVAVNTEWLLLLCKSMSLELQVIVKKNTYF